LGDWLTSEEESTMEKPPADRAERKTGAVLTALRAFLAAKTWDEARHIVLTHSALLSDAADALLALLITHQEDREKARALAEHRAILARCRIAGVEAAFAGYLSEDDVCPEGIAPEVWARVQAATSYDELRELVGRHPILVDAIRERIGQALKQEQARLVNAVDVFLAADSWVEARRAIEAHPVLLTVEAEIRLGQYAQFLEKVGEPRAIEILAERRWLLARCRAQGVEAAFEGRTRGRDGMRVDVPAEPFHPALVKMGTPIAS
jgi:hypothetical protein